MIKKSTNCMACESVYDIVTAALLGITEEWFEDAHRPLDPIIFARNEDTAHRVLAWIAEQQPMSTEEMAQQKPMSYYVALEQDRLHASEHGEVAVLTVQD